MSKHVAVKKIVLDINGKELSLSVEDARGLLVALKEVLGEREVRVVDRPYPVYPAPYYPYTPWVTYSTSLSPTTTSTTITCNSPRTYLSS